jgi:hypothetical protein
MDTTSNYGTINSFLVSDIFGEVVKHLGLGDLKPLPLVCKHWNRLYNDEQLWDELLRRNFLDLDSKNFTGTKKDAFFKMIRTKISVLEFSITWLDDHYWTTDNGTAIGSYFDKIAVLNAVCWLHVAGVVNVYPGTYQVIWRVYLKNGHNLQDDLFFEANPLEEGIITHKERNALDFPQCQKQKRCSKRITRRLFYSNSSKSLLFLKFFTFEVVACL